MESILRKPHPRIELIPMGVNQEKFYPFKNNTFDLVTMSFSLRNVENINITLNEINRVLKKNGSFIFVENIEGSIMHMIIRTSFQSSGWYYPNLKDFIGMLSNFTKIKYLLLDFSLFYQEMKKLNLRF